MKTEEKDLTHLFSKIDKIKSELNKILIIKLNSQIRLGVNATFIKEKPKDPFNEKSETQKEVGKTQVKTTSFEVYSKDAASGTTDKLVNNII